mmetsp:Transcript_8726/g.11993  ORF Transcript_8726/g.11993 Transcript_8726/m.11993 type:complete len:243 (-) Transcript_8726:276-1004(-)
MREERKGKSDLHHNMEPKKPAPSNDAQNLEEGSDKPDFLLNSVQICSVEHVCCSVYEDSETGDNRDRSVHDDSRRVYDRGIEAVRALFSARPPSNGENANTNPEHQKRKPSVTESIRSWILIRVLIALASIEIEKRHVLPAKSHGRDTCIRDNKAHPEVHFPTILSIPTTSWSYRDPSNIVVPVERRFCDVDNDPEEDREPRAQPSSCLCDLGDLQVIGNGEDGDQETKGEHSSLKSVCSVL